MGAATGTLVRSARASQPQSPRLIPPSAKKKKENNTRARQSKVAGARLEEFVDSAVVISSESIEEEEMSNLAVRFATLMRKRSSGPEGETTPNYDGKRMKWSSLEEEARKDWTVILVDSPDRASNDKLVLEGTPNEVGAPLEEGIPVWGTFKCRRNWRRGPISRKRLPDQVLLSTYVPPQERVHPPTGMVAPDPKGAL